MPEGLALRHLLKFFDKAAHPVSSAVLEKAA